MNQSTSAEAQEFNDESGLSARLRKRATELFYEHGPMSSMDLAMIAPEARRETWSSTISQLVKTGVLETRGRKICPVTNRSVLERGLTDAWWKKKLGG